MSCRNTHDHSTKLFRCSAGSFGSSSLREWPRCNGVPGRTVNCSVVFAEERAIADFAMAPQRERSVGHARMLSLSLFPAGKVAVHGCRPP